MMKYEERIVTLARLSRADGSLRLCEVVVDIIPAAGSIASSGMMTSVVIHVINADAPVIDGVGIRIVLGGRYEAVRRPSVSVRGC
jgi:hypothetical protein